MTVHIDARTAFFASADFLTTVLFFDLTAMMPLRIPAVPGLINLP